MPHNSLDTQLQPFAIRPKIQYCIEMGYPTDPSVYHSDVMQFIMLIYKNPKDSNETIIKFFDDQAPYNLRQQKVVEYFTYWAIVSYDYRSLMEQNSNKLLYVGLTYHTNRGNILIKLQFEDDNTCQEEVIESEEIEE